MPIYPHVLYNTHPSYQQELYIITHTKGERGLQTQGEESRNGNMVFHDEIHFLSETITPTKRNKNASKGDFIFTD